MTDFRRSLEALFPGRVQAGAPLAPYTTFRVGGPADWLIETRSSAEVVAALRLAHAAGVRVTVLGGGSNVLVSDAGVRGLVLVTRGGAITVKGLDRLCADAAVTINGLVRWAVHRGYAGLEAWAGTPGTVGGAVVGNAHFGGLLIGDLIDEVELAGRDGSVICVSSREMAFGYDRSRVRETGEVVLSAVFRVARGDPAALRRIARESLAFRKRTQPLGTRNAGCVFQNPDPSRDPVPPGVPCSAGALIDRAGLKGAAVGRARVSPAHANFIVNEGGATSRDIRALIERCRREVRAQFGVELREEIVYLGEFGEWQPC